ncbi:hypothetical protein M501DRAFT_1004823 [Patellaria atrata CBS 101060]|uniref:Myb-like DNA-binding domain-containing protein n=1 Tax=Patellaria atrata CBS 101060 TaxID=1346257 RepID=A0A9P4VR30_9PEZI|nr:hypothetical protein M501DRAFT_1004823 [Patellaria atrata CBS 101060]
MPAKIPLEGTAQLLWLCVKNSDMKTIDFDAVGKALGCSKSGAAQRFGRLKKALDEGMSVADASKPATPSKKTTATKGGSVSPIKRPTTGTKRKKPSKDDDDDSDDDAGTYSATPIPKKQRPVRAVASKSPKVKDEGSDDDEEDLDEEDVYHEHDEYALDDNTNFKYETNDEYPI